MRKQPAKSKAWDILQNNWPRFFKNINFTNQNKAGELFQIKGDLRDMTINCMLINPSLDPGLKKKS